MQINDVIYNEEKRKPNKSDLCPGNYYIFVGIDKDTYMCGYGYPYKKKDYGDCEKCRKSNSNLWSKKKGR